jgi:hypothetical protein
LKKGGKVIFVDTVFKRAQLAGINKIILTHEILSLNQKSLRDLYAAFIAANRLR